jgi:hypothetical protein
LFFERFEQLVSVVGREATMKIGSATGDSPDAPVTKDVAK